MDREEGPMDEWVERTKEFLSVCVHTILHAREIYPSQIFEQRRYLGVSVWQSRHPDVNAYVQQVIENAHSILQKNLAERFVVTTETKDGKPLDHVTIKCTHDAFGPNRHVADISRSHFSVLEEEFRSLVLRMGMLDQQMPKLPEDCHWKVIVITRAPQVQQEIDVMQQTLTSGKWFVDNNKISEQVALSQRGQNKRRTPKLVPFKSYRDELFNLSAYAHIFAVHNAEEDNTDDVDAGQEGMEVTENEIDK